MREPFVSQMHLVGLTLVEFDSVFNIYGAKYCSNVWIEHGKLNVTLVNVPLMLLGAIADAVRSVTPEPVGEPTHE